MSIYDRRPSKLHQFAFIWDSLQHEDCLTVFGEIDMANSHELKESLSRMAGRGRAIVVDLTACTYLDSNGLHVLADFAQKQRQFRVIAPATGSIPRIMNLVSLSEQVAVEYKFQPT